MDGILETGRESWMLYLLSAKELREDNADSLRHPDHLVCKIAAFARPFSSLKPPRLALAPPRSWHLLAHPTSNMVPPVISPSVTTNFEAVP
jgi:hypothetical protein